MRRVLLITFLLVCAAGAADPQRAAEIDRAYHDMVTAERALEDAKQQRDRLGPQPDKESNYFERKRSLEREVALKQWVYDQARERWVALTGRSSSG